MLMGMALAPAALAGAEVEDIRPTVSKIYPGDDGKLVYVPDDQGNAILDYSHAGYGGGGTPIPTVPVKETIWPVMGDNQANVQAAIDKVSALPPDKAGFRGAVVLRAGYYKMATPVKIQASGVVLRGEGMGDTGTILVGTGNPRRGPGGGTLVMVGGATGVAAKDETKQTVTDDYVPVGARTFKVANANGFKPGDAVIVRRIGNADWITEMGMSAAQNKFPWRPFNIDWDRVVVDVKGNAVTVDAPITCAIEKRWGGGELLKYEDPGRIEKVGVENLRGVSEFDPTVRTKEYGNMDRPNYVAEEYYSDENHFWTLIAINNAKNAWVRNVTALHFGNSLTAAQRGAKWVTVQDCVSREPISQRRGARRFTYLMEGQLALVQRCQSDKGRHSFVMGQSSSTNNVFLDCTATNPFSSSETHANWSTGALWDNVKAPLTARYWKDINIGWAGGNVVFWNCEGPFLVQKPPTAQNYSFGHLGVDAVVFNIPLQDPAKEGGFIESLDKHVSPRSLYLTQLRERLGEQAVRNIATPAQLG
jgi:pectin methylesterase-like acyl-CoA thioesterase